MIVVSVGDIPQACTGLLLLNYRQSCCDTASIHHLRDRQIIVTRWLGAGNWMDKVNLWCTSNQSFTESSPESDRITDCWDADITDNRGSTHHFSLLRWDAPSTCLSNDGTLWVVEWYLAVTHTVICSVHVVIILFSIYKMCHSWYPPCSLSLKLILINLWLCQSVITAPLQLQQHCCTMNGCLLRWNSTTPLLVERASSGGCQLAHCAVSRAEGRVPGIVKWHKNTPCWKWCVVRMFRCGSWMEGGDRREHDTALVLKKF